MKKTNKAKRAPVRTAAVIREVFTPCPKCAESGRKGENIRVYSTYPHKSSEGIVISITRYYKCRDCGNLFKVIARQVRE